MFFQRRIGLRRPGIAPREILNSLIVYIQRPVRSETFELAKTLSPRRGAQKFHGEIRLRNVIDGGMTCFEDSERSCSIGNRHSGMKDPDPARTLFESRRPRVIPHRLGFHLVHMSTVDFSHTERS